MIKQTSEMPPRKTNAGCTDLTKMAERELTAFFVAVTNLFGPEQARLSAEEWLEELGAMKGLPGSNRELRSISATVAMRLPTRVKALAAAS
jgi:hypothetical protein